MRDALTTPLPVTAMPHMQTEETTLNHEAKKQACVKTASLFCVKAFAIMKVIKTVAMDKKLAELKRRIQHC